jgi:hypothetical protein
MIGQTALTLVGAPGAWLGADGGSRRARKGPCGPPEQRAEQSTQAIGRGLGTTWLSL